MTCIKQFAELIARYKTFENNAITGYVLLTNDITWHKISKDVLKASEERISTIFESTLDKIFVWDKDCNYLYANAAELNYLGKSKNQVIGQNVRSDNGAELVPIAILAKY